MGNVSVTKVTLGKVTTDTGVTCSNPTVTLIGHPNVYINCVDQSKGIYDVQLPDNADLKCLEFSVDCNDDCRDCDPQIIKKCFCDDASDCPDCSDCIAGFCEPECPEEFCLDDTCVECTIDTQCPCNQVCDANGNCVCPGGKKHCDAGDPCCYDCCLDEDCPDCYVCTDDLDDSCKPKDCPGGACNPETDECVECVTSDHCGVNECCEENECVCCPGFTYDACEDKCIPLPPNACRNSGDCDECTDCTNYNPCTGYGTCSPKTCPPGFVSAEVDGVCQCVEECDCSNPDCSKVTDYCKVISSNICGCVPCEGDCSSGCQDECFCNPTTNQCEGNPCTNVACTNGEDCGEGCGCDEDTGLCIPCAALSCAANNCDKVLGCECTSSNTCEHVGCNDAPCSVGDDCPEGCGCREGKCVACDSFPCTPDECSDIDGCECLFGTCTDDGDDCDDTLTITKDNGACLLTGTLVKDNCCQCPQLTLDTKGQLISETDDNVTLNFIAEVRKGAYDGISVSSVPRVDEFTNENIAENEPPTAGTIQLSYTITYEQYDTSTGISIFQGITTTPATVVSGAFPGSGDTAQVAFNGVTLPQIGSETQVGNTLSIAVRIDLTFSLTNTLEFPNDCDYDPVQISKYTLTNDSDFDLFPTLAFGNEKAKVTSTEGCRKPMFKWTKTSNLENNVAPFRKIYVTGGPTTYTDVIGGDDGVESCFYYILDSDCTCAEPDDLYVVFCSPENLDFTLTPATCPNCIRINSFAPCEVNEDLTFRVQAGTLNFTFTKDTAPIGQLKCSATVIDQVIFSIECDVEEVCTKTYDAGALSPTLTPTTECSEDTTQFTAIFPSQDSTGACNVTKIEISQGGSILHTLVGSFSKVLPSGTYNAKVYWDCGCDPTDVLLQQDCCDYVLLPIVRDCSPCSAGQPNCYNTENGSIICEETPGVIYSIGGAGIFTGTVCTTIASYPETQALDISATKGNCPTKSISLQNIDSFCCENYDLQIHQIAEGLAIAVTGSSGSVTVTAFNNTTQQNLTVNDNGNGTWSITGHESGDSITVTATDDICGTVTKTFVGSGGDCDLTVALEDFVEGSVCRLRAVASSEICECRLGTYTITIDDVENLGTEFEITYTTALGGFDANPTAGQLFAGAPGSLAGQGFIVGQNTLNLPIPTSSAQTCFSSQIEVTLLNNPCIHNQCDNNIRCDVAAPCISGCSCDGVYPAASFQGFCECDSDEGDVEVRLFQGGNDLADNGDIASISVTVNGNNASFQAIRDAYVSSQCCAQTDTLTIVVTVVDTEGETYTGTFTINNPTYNTAAETNDFNYNPQKGLYLAGLEICRESNTLASSATLRFQLQGLQLEDNCNYPDVTQDFTIYINESHQPNAPQTIILDAVDPEARWIKFVWVRGGSVVHKEFSGSPLYTSVLPLVETIVGEEYDVAATCEPCVAEDSTVLCCLPTLDITVNGCNEDMDITATGNPGEYQIVYDSVTYDFTIPLSGTVDVNIPGTPDISEPEGIVRLASLPATCQETFDVPVFTPTAPACNPVPSYVPAAYVPNYAPIYTPIYTPNYAPIYTPGYSPDAYTPTYAPIYTPIYTPLYAPIYTPGYTPVYTPIYTPIYAPAYSPVYTPTYVPSYIPTATPATCAGCISSGSVCCNDLPTEAVCNSQATCYWTNPGGAGICECDTVPGSPLYSPDYTPIYVPGYAPVYTPLYVPNYTPLYSPLYAPIYVPAVGINCQIKQITHSTLDGNWGAAFNGVTVNGTYYAPDNPIIVANSTEGEVDGAAEAIANFVNNAMLSEDEVFSTIDVQISGVTLDPGSVDVILRVDDVDGTPLDTYHYCTYATWEPSPSAPSCNSANFDPCGAITTPAADITITFDELYHPIYIPAYAPSYSPTL